MPTVLCSPKKCHKLDNRKPHQSLADYYYNRPKGKKGEYLHLVYIFSMFLFHFSTRLILHQNEKSIREGLQDTDGLAQKYSPIDSANTFSLASY